MASGLSLNVDTTKSEFQNPMVELRQGDGNYQSLRVTVTSNGEPLMLDGWTINFMGTTAGGHKIVDADVHVINASNGVFDYTPTKAWGQDIGEFSKAYFKFTNGSAAASGANFRVKVFEAVDLTDEEAGDYISVVDVMIDKIKTDMDNKLADTQTTLTNTQNQANTVQSNVNDLNTNVNQLKAQNNNIITSDNTWTGKNTFTQPIDGSLKTRDITFSDFNDVAKNMVKYAGTWNVGTQSIANSPLANYYTVTVTPAISDGGSGYIELVPFVNGSASKYIAVVGSQKLSPWKSFAFDDNVLHNTGNETVLGDKTFNGKTSIKNTDLSYYGSDLSYYTGRIASGQDMTVIDDLLLIFDGKTTDHSVVQNIQTKVLSAGYSSTGALIDYVGTVKTHNLGHVNGVDYINGQLSNYVSTDLNNGYLVAYNGSGLPPEVSLFDNVNKNTTFFDVNNSTNIIFKEYTKTLDGDGSVSFGGDFKTILMTRVVNSKTIGIRVVKLGTGTNNYSDSTNDHSDLTSWGSFVSGKNDFQYNGTAKIVKDIMLDTSSINANSNQPQGQTYKGNSLFMGVGFNNSNIIEVKIFSNYAKITNNFFPPAAVSDGKDGEIEGVALHEGELIGLSSPSYSGQGALLYKIKLYGNANSVKKYGDESIGGNKSITGSLTINDANPVKVKQSSTVEFNSWQSSKMKATRFGNIVALRYSVIPNNNNTITKNQTSSVVIPQGYRPMEQWNMAVGGVAAGSNVLVNPDGTLTSGWQDVQYAGMMTAMYFTADPFPS